MFPNVNSVFSNWTSPVQLRLVSRSVSDFEAKETTLDVVPFEAVMQAMRNQQVDRKPEGERQWKWWDVWTDKKIALDSVVQDQNGAQFRVRSVNDWSQAGFFKYEMTEKPV